MNWFIIYLDDFRVEWLAYMPNVVALLQRLGLNFTSCFVNVPICLPSRVGILTGNYSKTHTVETNDESTLDTAIIAGDVVMSETFLGALDTTHRTGWMGKYFQTGTTRTPGGVNTIRQVLSANQYSASVWDGSSSTSIGRDQVDYLTDEAISFMGGSEPWALHWCSWEPHWPWECVTIEDTHRWSAEFWQVVDDDVADKPAWVQARAAVTDVNKAVTQFVHRQYAREATMVDRAIGLLLDEVDFETTNVIFTTDNGNLLAEHRYVPTVLGAPKFLCYDPCLRVPLIARGPSFTPGTNTDLVTHQDIYATICDVESISPPHTLDGVSLLATDPARDLLHRLGDATGTGAAGRPEADGISTMIDGVLFSYWDYDDSPTNSEEMYDKTNDPDELTNVAADGDYASEKSTCQSRLAALLA
jgi:arylsulfatase A-like enzyme